MTSHDQPAQKEISRRGFVGMLMTASAAFAVASLPLAAMAKPIDAERGGLEPGERLRIADVADVAEGKALSFSYPTADDPAILIHLPTGEFKAYNVSCTHLGCPVYWDPAAVKLKCPCHKGLFDPASGEPLEGPPKRPLHGVALSVENGVIYAIGRYQP